MRFLRVAAFVILMAWQSGTPSTGAGGMMGSARVAKLPPDGVFAQVHRKRDRQERRADPGDRNLDGLNFHGVERLPFAALRLKGAVLPLGPL